MMNAIASRTNEFLLHTNTQMDMFGDQETEDETANLHRTGKIICRFLFYNVGISLSIYAYIVVFSLYTHPLCMLCILLNEVTTG